MVPYFGCHECKQFVRNKPVKFGCKFWVAAHPIGYTIQFCSYIGEDENYNPTLGLGPSVVSKLAGSHPNEDGSSYHTVMDNYFASRSLSWVLKETGIAATETV